MVDIIPSGINTTATLSNSGDAYGRIDTPGDTDMYKVTLIGGNYHFNLGADPALGSALNDTVLRVYNSSGHLIAVDDDNGAGSSSYLDLTLASGTYYVAVNGFSSNTGDYLLNVEMDTPHIGGIAGILQPGMSLTNRLDDSAYGTDFTYFDHDDFQLYVQAGVTYSVTLAPQPGVDGPNSNPIEPAPVGLEIPSVGYSVRSSAALTHTFTATTTGNITVTSLSGYYSDRGYYTISVTSNAAFNEHRPSGVSATVSMYEDTARAFSTYDFGMTDADGDGLAAIYITSLPTRGSLTLDGQAVVVGQAISPYVLQSLRWTPPANANGSAVASFDFTVMDTSERRAIDLTPNRITFSVAAVNDAPVITSGGGQASAAIAVAENRAAVTSVTASDVDSAVTYRLAGADAALFTINATTGALSFRTGADFEAPRDSGRDNVYDVSVLATDGALTDSQALKIYVRDVNGNTVAGTNGNNTVDGSRGVNGRTATIEEEYIDGKGGNDKLSGLAGNDTIIGGAGKDTLTGGNGFDRLDGGASADRFVFSAKFNVAGIDTIVKFEHDKDKLALENKVFKALGSSVTKDEFYAKAGATAAHDKSDHIIYDKSTGRLFYDADGKGGAGAIHFATLSNKPTLDHGDFTIV